ncbi:hypothetical protein BU15DRAFT_73077 [Melanogaster broomeanus]|nr:hypothetical protein BU15DRAFT_73077 [Melanogaster broomeanus]
MTEEVETFTDTCICNRAFTDLRSLRRHERTCSTGRKRLSEVLAAAQAAYHRKRVCIRTAGPNATLVESESLYTSRETTGKQHDSLSPAQHCPSRRTRSFKDAVPEPPLSAGVGGATQPATVTPHMGGPPLSQNFRTRKDAFGIHRMYTTEHPPTHDPNPLPQPCNSSPPDCNNDDNPYHPYPNASSLFLGDWFWNHGTQKSKKGFKRLLEIIGSPQFRPEDIRTTHWEAIDRELSGMNDDYQGEHARLGMDNPSDGWMSTPITISVPFHGCCKNPGPKPYIVPGFRHRSLVAIIRESLLSSLHHRNFHFEPFELCWNPPHTPSELQLYSELYNSPAFLDAQTKLQHSPPEPGCVLPRCIVGLMFWSDATVLTTFGEAKLWPLYVYFGNESKYLRCQPSERLCTHVAYFMSLPDEFKDFATLHSGGKLPGDTFFTHSSEHGIVLKCGDGVERRLYPRIFTYSADYPEKVLIANLRNLGHCPCPRCLVSKDRVHLFATGRDMLERELLARSDTQERRDKISSARELIYEKNYAVDNSQVEELLRTESMVPTVNAFSTRLGHTGFDFFMMLVVDLLHEFELGVWKAIFTHLLRILDSLKKGELAELDHRYRDVPNFGRDTIRRFRKNVSDMKRTAARDFEDLLQCSIPVFDRLLPEPHNTHVQQLLFQLCHWHGLAKLRMHTDETLDIMVTITSKLANQVRNFAVLTSPAFSTRELRREAERRRRRQAQEKRKTQHTAAYNAQGRRTKAFNLQTYKLHALADYPAQIKMFGTTDSYSTQPGELEHRTSKGRFPRTSRKNYIEQLVSIGRRQERIGRIRARIDAANKMDPVPDTQEQHHHIGKSQNYPEELMAFMQQRSNDPAANDFVLKLKTHLLPRIRQLHSEEPCNEAEATTAGPQQSPMGNAGQPPLPMLNHIILNANCMYRHHILRVNYTTYDLRRETDMVNPGTSHRHIMLLSPTGIGGHHFCYARVLGIYHANIIYTGSDSRDYRPRRVEFLWVHWFELIPGPSGWAHAALDRLRLAPIDADDAFGFIDPADVLRCCHLIPAFTDGRANEATSEGLLSNEWRYYYVNRFVDRDMLMRYHWGLAPGHSHTYIRSNQEHDTNQTAITSDDMTARPNVETAHLFEDESDDDSLSDTGSGDSGGEDDDDDDDGGDMMYDGGDSEFGDF